MGLMIGFPAGIRINLTEHFGLLGEGRWFYNSFSFMRNIENEKDSASLTMTQVLAGLSFSF
ncbi:MAG: hypothetical protein JW827_00845 [Spirochaetes bacterium]|nr:hypothetical protein [Spirochaetota bacterium]